jgi:hypothetical protein
VIQSSADIKLVGKSTPSNFGFAIRSPHAFRFLRRGDANGALRICSRPGLLEPSTEGPILQWTLQGTVNVSAKLYVDGSSYRYWISDAGWFNVDPVAASIQIPEDGDDIIREQRLWSIPTMLCAMHRGDFFLHAAAAEIDGGAVLLAAPGHHGKTTLAMAFHRLGYRVVSEDSACCRLGPVPAMLPGPALLRLRHDVFDGRAPAGTHVAAIREDRIYLGLDENRRGSDNPIPLRGIILLRESSSEIHLEPLPSHKALPDLWALTFHFPSDSDRARCFKQLTGLASAIPIWNLYRPIKLTSLDATVASIVDTLSSARHPSSPGVVNVHASPAA